MVDAIELRGRTINNEEFLEEFSMNAHEINLMNKSLKEIDLSPLAQNKYLKRLYIAKSHLKKISLTPLRLISKTLRNRKLPNQIQDYQKQISYY